MGTEGERPFKVMLRQATLYNLLESFSPSPREKDIHTEHAQVFMTKNLAKNGFKM